MITAAHKSSGKTTISLGICAALRMQGIKVAPFKKGPDYIDPLWLSLASGRACYNLDFWTMSNDEIIEKFINYSQESDISLIEGNKGLYDGMDIEGNDSNAALAKLLKTPIILVIDAQGITRGVAPLVLGYQLFDPNVNIVGIILNKVAGIRQETKLRNVLARYNNLPIIGAVARDEKLTIVERHLGLVPSNETKSATDLIKQIAVLVSNQIDIELLKKLAIHHPEFPNLVVKPKPPASIKAPIKIGIPKDEAFAFYYPDDLDALSAAGAELVFFDALHDHLPNIDGLFIGGGFPEVKMEALELNIALRTEIKLAIDQGLPVYAECGGLMYLARRIQWGNRISNMVGALAVDVVMTNKPIGRGYVYLKETNDHPWFANKTNALISAHEFHYSYLENLDNNLKFAYHVQRGFGIDGNYDGIIYRNVLACYCHQRHTYANPWITNFLNFVKNKRFRSL